MSDSKPTPDSEVGSVYLHVSNSGVAFSVLDGRHGPTVQIHCSTFGNMDHTITLHTTNEGLEALRQLFQVAVERTYKGPYLHNARPLQSYVRDIDDDGKPILVAVSRPEHSGDDMEDSGDDEDLKKSST